MTNQPNTVSMIVFMAGVIVSTVSVAGAIVFGGIWLVDAFGPLRASVIGIIAGMSLVGIALLVDVMFADPP